MQLFPMNDQEFDFWMMRSKVSYAEDKRKANSFTKEEAAQIAENDFATLLPQGLESQNNHLYTAKDEAKQIVGFIWFCVKGELGNRRAFIYDLIVEEAFRGKGVGKAIMLLAETEAKKLGVSRIGLHVFGFNKIAIGLYRSLGYETTDLTMEKVLSP